MHTNAFIIAVTAVTASVAACENPNDRPRGLHEECVICTTGSYYECTGTTELPCQEGLYCATATFSSCEAYAELGEPCSSGILCTPGLFCGPESVCETPLIEGALCDASSTCAPELACNGGGVPADPTAGTCAVLGGEANAPCAFSAGPRGWTARGCADGLVCAPATAFDGTDPDALATATSGACCAVCDQPGSQTAAGDLGACLGWPGTCTAPGLGARGDRCTADAACASGRCIVLPPPLPTPDADSLALTAPWPGVCAGPDDAIESAVCDPIAGCALACDDHADCLPGTLCNPLHGRCFAAHRGRLDDRCGIERDGPSLASDAVCAFGLACQVDALRCRQAGDARDGDSCDDEVDCAGGFVCVGGACVAHGQRGDSCDFERRCDFDLRCSLADGLCEEPGVVGQGGDCDTDAECDKGLYCTSTPGTCQWLGAAEGATCERCEPGLVCVTDGETPVGTCARAATAR